MSQELGVERICCECICYFYLVVNSVLFHSISFRQCLFLKYGNRSYRPFYNASIHGNVSSTDYICCLFLVFLSLFFLPWFSPNLFYQFRIFQRCLHCCRIRCTLLHEMANILHTQEWHYPRYKRLSLVCWTLPSVENRAGIFNQSEILFPCVSSYSLHNVCSSCYPAPI